MASLPERQHSTVAQIIQWRERQAANEQPRPYLGASQIRGRAVPRALWYSFRWATQRQFDGRMLRLFERGQREEAVFIAELRAIGTTVHEGRPGAAIRRAILRWTFSRAPGRRSYRAAGSARHLACAGIQNPQCQELCRSAEKRRRKIQASAPRTDADLHGADRHDSSFVSGRQQRH